jgi:hypothetical protein
MPSSCIGVLAIDTITAVAPTPFKFCISGIDRKGIDIASTRGQFNKSKHTHKLTPNPARKCASASPGLSSSDRALTRLVGIVLSFLVGLAVLKFVNFCSPAAQISCSQSDR